jgi:hypothetical protein
MNMKKLLCFFMLVWLAACTGAPVENQQTQTNPQTPVFKEPPPMTRRIENYITKFAKKAMPQQALLIYIPPHGCSGCRSKMTEFYEERQSKYPNKLLLITAEQDQPVFVRDSADIGSEYGLATDFPYAFEIQNGKCIQATRLDANAIPQQWSRLEAVLAQMK